MDLLLIKPVGEITLKTTFVRRFFNKKLKENIKIAFKINKIPFQKIQAGNARFFIKTTNTKKAQTVLKNIFGIHSIALVHKTKLNSSDQTLKEATDFFSSNAEKIKTFKVKTKRIGKHDFSSQEFNEKLGSKILEKFPKLKVKLKNPDKTFFVDIIQKKVFLYDDETKGMEGLPVGTQGDIALIVSGSEEELVAGFLMLKRGCRIFPITKKNSKKPGHNLKKLEKFNSSQELVLKNFNKLPDLIKDKNVSALVSPDLKLKPKTFIEFDSKQLLPVYRPLVLLDKNTLNEAKRFLK